MLTAKISPHVPISDGSNVAPIAIHHAPDLTECTRRFFITGDCSRARSACQRPNARIVCLKILLTQNFAKTADTIERACPQCGKPLTATAKFCKQCGARIDVAADSSQVLIGKYMPKEIATKIAAARTSGATTFKIALPLQLKQAWN